MCKKCVVLIGEFVVTVKNRHRICMHKCTWAVAQTHEQQKREDSYLNESSLSVFLICDMLTKVSVIFSLKIPRLWRDILKESDIEALRLQRYSIRHKLAKQISLGISRITLRSNRSRHRRIELA